MIRVNARIRRIGRITAVTVVGLILAFPLIYLIFGSLMTSAQLNSFPPQFIPTGIRLASCSRITRSTPITFRLEAMRSCAFFDPSRPTLSTIAMPVLSSAISETATSSSISVTPASGKLTAGLLTGLLRWTGRLRFVTGSLQMPIALLRPDPA